MSKKTHCIQHRPISVSGHNQEWKTILAVDGKTAVNLIALTYAKEVRVIDGSGEVIWLKEPTKPPVYAEPTSFTIMANPGDIYSFGSPLEVFADKRAYTIDAGENTITINIKPKGDNNDS